MIISKQGSGTPVFPYTLRHVYDSVVNLQLWINEIMKWIIWRVIKTICQDEPSPRRPRFCILVRSCVMQHIHVKIIESMSVLIRYTWLTSDDVLMGTTLQIVDWEQVPVHTGSNYVHIIDLLLTDLVLPGDVAICNDERSTDHCIVDMFSNIYKHIMNRLQSAD